MKTIQPLPSHLWLNLTNNCNSSCEFCSAGKPRGFSGHPFSKIKNCFDSFPQPSKLWIVFGGAGEPTVHPEFHDVVRYLGERGFNIRMITNGILLEKHADVLAKSQCALHVSVHGMEETHNRLVRRKAFQQVFQGIETIRGKNPGIAFAVNYVLCPENLNDLLKMAQFLKEKKLKLNLNPLIGTDKVFSEDDIKTMRRTLEVLKQDYPDVRILPVNATTEDSIALYTQANKDYYDVELGADKVVCNSIFNRLILSHDGELQLCAKANSLGNAYESSIMELWGNDLHQKVIADITRVVNETGSYPKSCAHCCYLERIKQ